MRLCENLEILICHLVTVWEALGKTCAARALQDSIFGITTIKGQPAWFAAPEAWQERAQPNFWPSRTWSLADWAATKQLRCPSHRTAAQWKWPTSMVQWAKQPVLPPPAWAPAVLSGVIDFAAFSDTDEERVIEKREQAKINWQGSTTKEGKDRKLGLCYSRRERAAVWVMVGHNRIGWEFLRTREVGDIMREGDIGKMAELQSYLKVGNVGRLTAATVWVWSHNLH